MWEVMPRQPRKGALSKGQDGQYSTEYFLVSDQRVNRECTRPPVCLHRNFSPLESRGQTVVINILV